MDEYHIIPTETMLELSSRLKQVFVLHITYRSPDLDDGDICIGCFISCLDFLLDEIGEVWDDLDSTTEEVSMTLSSNELFIKSTRGE